MRLKIKSVERPAGLDDDQTGLDLVDLVRKALEVGQAPPVAVVLRDEKVDIINLSPVIEARFPLNRFLASMSSVIHGGVDAIGVMGTFKMHRQGEKDGVPVAMVFLEWEDCRWWQWRALVHDQVVLDGTETYYRAVDGDPLPHQLGRWWSLARRSK
ncbi:MAG: hypothetical protein HN348_35595, partial [Proteobacteria bacterium]|nr:hypothetical protein [Pseudomonadota bacterium]